LILTANDAYFKGQTFVAQTRHQLPVKVMGKTVGLRSRRIPTRSLSATR